MLPVAVISSEEKIGASDFNSFSLSFNGCQWARKTQHDLSYYVVFFRAFRKLSGKNRMRHKVTRGYYKCTNKLSNAFASNLIICVVF